LARWVLIVERGRSSVELRRYPAVIGLWDNAWAEFIPFLDYGACRRIALSFGRGWC
jgi:hypothetical protein